MSAPESAKSDGHAKRASAGIPKGVDRAAELVHVAAQLFQRRGYDATSMQDIADDMGLLKGSIYHYIKTKEDLLWIIMEPALVDLVATARAILNDEELRITERLALAMRAHGQTFEENFPHMFVLTRENGETLSPERQEKFQQLRAEYFVLWRDAVAEGIERKELRAGLDPRIVVHGIFGMLNWMFRWFDIEGELPAGAVADQFADMALSGLVRPS
jgi:AcrR family transcriptional regulator